LPFAIPNGGWLNNRGSAIKLKREGQKNGVPDVFVPFKNKNHCGLFIEFKSDSGTLSPEQKYWLDTLTKQGYLCAVLRDSQKAFDLLTAYFNSLV